jgi:hypothetical protein
MVAVSEYVGCHVEQSRSRGCPGGQRRCERRHVAAHSP